MLMNAWKVMVDASVIWSSMNAKQLATTFQDSFSVVVWSNIIWMLMVSLVQVNLPTSKLAVTTHIVLDKVAL